MVLDSSLTFDQHVRDTVRNCNFRLRALRHIRPSFTSDVTNTIACSIIGSRLDYCNSLLVGISEENLDSIQRVQSKAACIVCNAGRHSPSSELLHSLHWYDSECRDTRRKTRAAERRYWRTLADDDKLAWAAELRTLHSLYRRKTDDFRRTEIAASNGNTKKLWRTLQGILGETCRDETMQRSYCRRLRWIFSRQGRRGSSVYFRYAVVRCPI